MGRPAMAAPDSNTLQSQAIRVFLDCQGRIRGCDRDFIVTDVNFVNWMRDRFDADVQILVSGLTNGGGGTENTVTIMGVDEANPELKQISWVSPVARALLKAVVGDLVRLRMPAGEEELEVLAISYPPGE